MTEATAANPFQRAALDAIRQALMRGAVDEARQRTQTLLAKAPELAEALHLDALIASREGRHGDARAQLERALLQAPAAPPLLTSLGHVCEAQGDWQAALDAFDRLLDVRPDDFAARLFRGRMLERLARSDEALFAYARAIRNAQEQGRWVSAETTAPAVQDAVRHAIGFVNRNVSTFYERAFAPLLQRHGRADIRRVETALAMHIGRLPMQYEDPRQQPTFLYFPGLPTSPYLPLQDLVWRESLQARTAAIQAELKALLPTSSGREAVFHTGELAQENLRGVQQLPPSWNGYYFHRHGEARAGNRAACPNTAAALDALPLARIPGHAPEVLFSVFSPGTHLLPHRGVTNIRLVGHLPLIVPRDCALNVAGEQHAWREGEVVVFDDTYEHEAWNRSEDTRVVLIFDLWNPHLTAVEREAASALVLAISDFRKATGLPDAEF